jgi:hypothetical protein
MFSRDLWVNTHFFIVEIEMKSHFPSLRHVVPAVIGLAMASATVHADITGFSNLSQFTITQNDAGSAPTVPSPGTLELTNGGGEARSVFANAPQNISQFTVSFTYQAIGTTNSDPGATLVLENDPRGASAVGNTSVNYGFQGITKSVGVTFDLSVNTTGFFTNGSVSGGGASGVSPVILDSGDPINVQLTYSGSTLTENLVDTVTSAKFSTTDLVLTSIPTIVGGNTAFVGLTAASSVGADEFFSNLQFTSAVPEPACLSLFGVGAIAALIRRRRA